MATAEELLAASAGATEPIEEILVADPETRVISIPATITNLGVESDDDVKTLQFKVPRYYGKIDLSTFKVQINFKNSADVGDFYPIKDFDSVDEDFIRFTWVVDRSALTIKGRVKFSICMKLYDDDGIVVKEWNTTYAILPVLEGLETQGEIVENNPSVFDQLMYRLYAVEAATGNGQDGYYTVVRVYESDRGAEFEVVDKDGMSVASIRHGATYTPNYDLRTGILSWSNDWGLPNPEPVSICGPKGIKGDQGKPGKDGKVAPILHLDTPFTVYDLPIEGSDSAPATIGHPEAYYTVDGKTTKLSNCTVLADCPKFLGWNIEGSNVRLYLYIVKNVPSSGLGDMLVDNWTAVYEASDGSKVPYYRFNVDSERNAYNCMNNSHSRIIKIDEDDLKFYYSIEIPNTSKAPGKVTIFGCDALPGNEMDIPAVVPNWVSSGGNPQVGYSSTISCYSIVLPTDSYYAVLRNKPSVDQIDYPDGLFNVSYEDAEGNVNVIPGASFGYIPANVGPALLRIPIGCTLDDITISTSKPVQSNMNSGRRRLAKEIGKDAITKFKFTSQKDILWNDSERLMETGRMFYGVPYSSRWTNSHFVGFEVSPETALNALNDPYSIAYDGGVKTRVVDEETGEVTVTRFDPVNTTEPGINFEIGDDGGPGYGLVCSAFSMLMNGNPYPQTNRGFTFDSGFSVEKVTDVNAGMLMVNRGMTHVVMVDEVYDNGYSLLEATDPCVAKTIHTGNIEKASYADSKTNVKFLDDYVYSVKNWDIDGYDKNLTNFDVEVTESNARPWRGHKCVYGPWDKSERGSGIGVTFKNAGGAAVIQEPSTITRVVAADGNTHYADISWYVEQGGSGTYKLISDAGESYFRYFNHDDVVLNFDEDGRAYFSHDDVEYVYVEVEGYGGEFSKYTADDFGKTEDEWAKTGPMVIAKGKRYPDLAKHPSRILDVRAAIVSDPTMNDCWGKYSVPASFGRSYYRNNDDDIARTKADAIVGEASGEFIALTDSSYDPVMNLKLYGKTAQVTTTGAQLLDFSKMSMDSGGTTTSKIIDSGKTVTITGTKAYAMGYIDVDVTGLVGKTLYLSGSKSGGNTPSLTARLIKADGTKTYISALATGYTVLADDVTISLQFIANNTATALTSATTATFKDVMISAVSGAEWEPYSGGVASPSPEFKQELENVDNPVVHILGKNLIWSSVSAGTTETRNGVDFTTNADGSISVTGTPTSAIAYNIIENMYLPAGTYCLSGAPSNASTKFRLQVNYKPTIDGVESTGGVNMDTAVTFTLPYDAYVRAYIYAAFDLGAISGTFYPQLEMGSTSTEYEAAKHRSMIIPRIVPGIPVTSGGNYTDSDGKQWVCDEVDFERGVYVQRIYTQIVEFYGTAYGDGIRYNANLEHVASSGFDGAVLCDSLPFHKNASIGARGVRVAVTSPTKLVAWYDDMVLTNATVSYILATPIETKLTAHELTLYRVLSTHHPNTAIMNDSGAGMYVKYLVNTESYIREVVYGDAYDLVDEVVTQDKIQAAVDAWLSAHYATAEGVAF